MVWYVLMGSPEHPLHFSPAIRTVDASHTDELVALCQDYIAMALEQPSQDTGFYEDSFGMTDDRIEADPILVGIYDAVARSIGIEKYGKVWTRVVTDPAQIASDAAEFPGIPLYTWHTDFEIVKRYGKARLLRRTLDRYTFTTGGEGTLAIEGPIDITNYRKIHEIPCPNIMNAVEIENGLNELPEGLVGGNDNFLRAPVDTSEFESLYPFTEARADVWNIISPDTVHAMNTDLTLGRIIIATSRT